MYTAGGADVLGESHERGSLTPGKVADLAVLERDPTTVAADELKTIETDLVLLDGEIVYRRPGAFDHEAAFDAGEVRR
jgi:predicted amidohydrolase YtcJ